ncbi:hypothetical protein OsI_00188 [Oryza sativa Indica Group]|uniref:Uncharacterized protein n=1 Tax=Oryza sativa subsp. indica TaxID=39946 RepID=B8AD02_ORYSI|nr:hypothetical protein OsI_00188 [Oryza sativa Indica Group]
MAAVTLLALGNDAPDVAGERRRGRDGERHGDERDGPDDERGDERASAASDGRRGGGDGGDQRVGRRSAWRGGRGEGPAADSPRRRSAPLRLPPRARGPAPAVRLPPLRSAGSALVYRRRCSAPPAARSLHARRCQYWLSIVHNHKNRLFYLLRC